MEKEKTTNLTTRRKNQAVAEDNDDFSTDGELKSQNHQQTWSGF